MDNMFVSLEECLEGYESRLDSEENNFEEDKFSRQSFSAIPESGDIYKNMIKEYHVILREGWDGSETIIHHRY
jgi:hypothetical protein